MSTIPALNALSAPLRALRLLAVDFPELPAPVIDVSSIYPERLSLSLHPLQGSFAAFEAWRVALGIAPAAVDFHVQSDHCTAVMSAQTRYGGAEIVLTGYMQVAERVGVAW
ncbi:hypothetical protein ACFRIC_28760 [Streptomyces sp. NPDC056738]|uniref:hypothetical protein n=1 Tax=Streptomyces sp. NPDC056738 TaxID=3345933 RepID=UPI00369CADEA